MQALKVHDDPVIYDCGGGWAIAERRHPSGFTYWFCHQEGTPLVGPDNLNRVFKTLSLAFNYVAGIRGLLS